MNAFWTLLLERLPELWNLTGEHLVLTGSAVGLAVLLGLPLGILAHRFKQLRSGVLGAVGILQTIPSLAMLGFLLVLIGKLGVVPAVIALVLYALLPIVRNTLAGLDGVSDQAVEAARGVGMTRKQRLMLVELPLAGPIMLAGIRTAAVISVGIATLAAFIGAGGLGVFIFRGMSMMNIPLIVLGAAPAALLALLVDFALWATEHALQPQTQHQRASIRGKIRKLGYAAPLLLIALGLITSLTTIAPADVRQAKQHRIARSTGTVRIGSKEFAEQRLLGQMMARMIEAHTDLLVQRHIGLGGTMICHQALTQREIDLYAEYTGTGYQVILEQSDPPGPFSVYADVDRQYRRKFQADWLEPFGFNNTYAITVRQSAAEQNGWETISDLVEDAPDLTAGFTSEFQERADGYPGLQKAYGLNFAKAEDVSSDLIIEALAKGQVDVICAFATDGRIAAYDLKVLQDDRGFFPPYDAAPVVRMDTLQKHPELRAALSPLFGLLTDEIMQRLNYRIQGDGKSPGEVAEEFLVENNLLAPEAVQP
jgi:osmoprotectant transport system permease protein